MECKSLRDSAEILAKYDVKLFAASVDDPETNKKFAESLDLPYPILSDPEKTAAKALGVLHPSGRFAQRWTFYFGEDGTVKYIDKEVSVRDHGRQVAERLESLGIPKKESDE